MNVVRGHVAARMQPSSATSAESFRLYLRDYDCYGRSWCLRFIRGSRQIPDKVYDPRVGQSRRRIMKCHVGVADLPSSRRAHAELDGDSL